MQVTSAGAPQIQIKANDKRACFNCTYWVTVVAKTWVQYSIVAEYGEGSTMLISGVPFDGTVLEGAQNIPREYS